MFGKKVSEWQVQVLGWAGDELGAKSVGVTAGGLPRARLEIPSPTPGGPTVS